MTNHQSLWHQAIPGALILTNQIHVWRMSLDLSEHQRANMLAILSADEIERAGRFHFEKNQNRFISARGMLRQILGLYLGEKPQRLQFEYTAFGKPVFGTNSDYKDLHFNLSHSESFALCAITHSREIGIDIERVRNEISVAQIVRRFFSSGEIHSIETLHEEKQNQLFFQYWTRKEAFLKGMGQGLSFPMEQCDVSLMSGVTFSPVIFHHEKSENSDWHVKDLFPAEGYVAAIAVEGRDCDLSCFQYSI